MMPGTLFGRSIPRGFESVDSALATISTDGLPADRAIIENLRMDARVTDSRADAFMKLIRDDRLGPLEALQRCTNRTASEFKEHAVNQVNLVKCPVSIHEEHLPHDTEFVSIMTLFPPLQSEMKTLMRKGTITWTGAVENDDQLGESEFYGWLERLASGDTSVPLSELQLAVEGAHRALLDQNGGTTDRIVWVGLHHEFDSLYSKYHAKPVYLLEAFGLGHLLKDIASNSENGQTLFVLLLRYSISEARVVARPSVIEAGQNEWHFPTSGGMPAKDGGRTMILGQASKDGVTPLREYVHTYRPIRQRDVVGLFKIIPEIGYKIDVDLARVNHRNWLYSQGLI